MRVASNAMRSLLLLVISVAGPAQAFTHKELERWKHGQDGEAYQAFTAPALVESGYGQFEGTLVFACSRDQHRDFFLLLRPWTVATQVMELADGKDAEMSMALVSANGPEKVNWSTGDTRNDPEGDQGVIHWSDHDLEDDFSFSDALLARDLQTGDHVRVVVGAAAVFYYPLDGAQEAFGTAYEFCGLEPER